jgi:hypothetical protein
VRYNAFYVAVSRKIGNETIKAAHGKAGADEDPAAGSLGQEHGF